MTEKEFQEKYNLTDDELAKVKFACMTLRGVVCKVEDFKKDEKKVKK